MDTESSIIQGFDIEYSKDYFHTFEDVSFSFCMRGILGISNDSAREEKLVREDRSEDLTWLFSTLSSRIFVLDDYRMLF